MPNSSCQAQTANFASPPNCRVLPPSELMARFESHCPNFHGDNCNRLAVMLLKTNMVIHIVSNKATNIGDKTQHLALLAATVSAANDLISRSIPVFFRLGVGNESHRPESLATTVVTQ